MRKYLTILGMLFSLFIISPAFANCDGISTNSLNEADNIALKQKCVELQAKASEMGTSAITAEKVGEYADIGKKYGIAISEVAKSLGTTVNEIAQTPVGEFMLVIVAYKVIGRDMLGFITGFFWFVTMIPLWIYMFNKLVLKNRMVSITYNDQGKVIGRESDPLNYDKLGGLIFGLAILLMLIAIAGFIIVFH